MESRTRSDKKIFINLLWTIFSFQGTIMKHIVLNKPYLYVENSIPKEWKASMQLVDHKDWSNLKCDYMQDEFYVCNDFGYNTIAKSNKVPINRGFCKALSDLANDKYQARANMETMKSIQHVLCDDNIVNWPFNRSDCLFAKPVHGFAAQGTVRNARHGTVLPDIGEPYLIEKYIDDKYPRLSVDGYLCGDRIGILATCDNVYLPTQKIQYHYLGTLLIFFNQTMTVPMYKTKQANRHTVLPLKNKRRRAKLKFTTYTKTDTGN